MTAYILRIKFEFVVYNGYCCMNRSVVKSDFVRNFAGENNVEIHLVLPWQDNVRIHYSASTAWPVTSNR